MSIMQHKGDYTILALMIAGYITFILRFQAVPRYLFLVTMVFAVLYILWGVCHHLHTHSLSLRTMLEYFLVAALAIVIVATLLV